MSAQNARIRLGPQAPTISEIIACDALAAQLGRRTFDLTLPEGRTLTLRTGSLRRGDDDGHRAGDELGGGIVVLADQSGGHALMGQIAALFDALPGQRVGIQGNYCPAVPGQLVEPAVYDLESGAGAGYPGGPDPKAIYMAVSQTEAVAVPSEVDPWLQAFAAGQLALAARA